MIIENRRKINKGESHFIQSKYSKRRSCGGRNVRRKMESVTIYGKFIQGFQIGLR